MLSKKETFLVKGSILAVVLLFGLTAMGVATLAHADGHGGDGAVRYEDLKIHTIDRLPYIINETGIYNIENNLTYSGESDYMIYVNPESNPNWNSSTEGPIIINGGNHVLTYTGNQEYITGIEVETTNGVSVNNLTINHVARGVSIQDVYSYSNNYDNDIILTNLRINVFTHDGVGMYFSETELPIIIDNVIITLEDPPVMQSKGILFDSVYTANIYDTMVNGGDIGVDVDDSDYITMYNTSIVNAKEKGIYIHDDSEDILLNNIRISNTLSADTALEIEESRYIVLLNSHITDNNNGVRISASSQKVVLENNYLGNNSGVAVDISDASYLVKMDSNIITGNENGVYVSYGDPHYNILRMNTNLISNNNGYGLKVSHEGGGDNQLLVNISDNTFIDNTINVNMTGVPATDIQDGFTLYGNYYSGLGNSTFYTIQISNSTITDNGTRLTYDPELILENAYALYDTRTHVLTVVFNVTNINGIGANLYGVDIAYMKNPVIHKSGEPNWLPLSFNNTNSIEDGEYVSDYSNTTLYEEDDGYISYKMPFTVNLMGYRMGNLSASTNGYIELTNSNIYDEEERVLGEEYVTHPYIYNYYITSWASREGNSLNTMWNEAVIYGVDGDLYYIDEATDGTQGVGVFNLPGAVVVMYNGTSIEDGDIEHPIEYQLIITENGTLQINIGKLYTSGYSGGDAFLGVSMLNPYYRDISGVYQPRPNTTWVIDDVKMHNVGQEQLSTQASSTRQYTVSFDLTTPLPNNAVVFITINKNLTQSTSTEDKMSFIPVIYYTSPNETSPEKTTLKPHKLSSSERRTLNNLTKFVENNPIHDEEEFNQSINDLKGVAESMINQGLFDRPTSLSEHDMTSLRNVLEAVYGSMLERYPSAQGRVYLLYWLYTH